MWDPNPATDLVLNYNVCVGTTSLSCNLANASVPATQTSYAFTPVPGTLYRVAVRAVSAAGSGNYSPEVLVSIPSLGTLANRTNTVSTAISPVTITASDPDGSSITYTHTGLPIGLTLNQTTGVITGTPTSAGTYNVTIFAADNLETASASFVWTIQAQSSDTTAPTLAITSHTNGQTVTTASITLGGTATDSGAGNNGIQSVTVNGTAATGGTATGSNTANWSRSVSLVTGANTLTVVATDTVGNARTTSITINRTAAADTTAPTLAITSHTNGQTVTTASITLSGTATDSGAGGSGITSVTVNGTAATGGTATGSNTANWSRSVSLATGANAITVVATDGAGNARTSSITINRTAAADTTAPALAITSHTNGQTVTTASITLSGTATDSGAGGSGIASVSVNGNAATGGTATGSNTANWSASVSLVTGANAITVIAVDGAGNARTSSITINRAAADTTAPTLAITSHSNGQTVSTSSITLSGTATDNGTGGSGITSVTVNGSSATGGTATGNNTANWSRSVSLVTGANTLTVVAKDGANNTRTSTITVTRGTVTPALSAVSVTPASGSGASQTFAAVFSDTVGATDLSMVYVKFDTASAGGTNSCMVRYDRAANRLSLRDNAGTWPTGAAPGGTGTQSNSQCSVSLSGSSVAVSGMNLTLNIAMTFAGVYAGPKNSYLYASNASGLIVDWQSLGTWTVPNGGTLTAGPVTPNAGSGAAQVFSAQFSDALGATDLALVYLKFDTAAPGGTNTCMVRYDRAAATASLRDDAGVWQSPQPFALGGTQQNSQCAINFSGSSASVSGQTLTLNVAMSFKVAYAGAKNIYAYASTNAGAITDWQQAGTWTIPSSMLSADAVTPNSGSGSSASFAAQFSDQKGVFDFGFVYLRFATGPSGATNVCMVRYDPGSGTMSLRDDAGNWLAAQTFAQGGTQQNSQCSIAFSTSSASSAGTTLTLTVNVTFKAAYAGAKNIYSYASSLDGSFTDWQLRGTWTVQ